MTLPGAVADGQWRRPSPRSLLVAPLRIGKELLPSLLPLVVVAIAQGGYAYWLLVFVVALPVVIALLRWWNTAYRIADGQFQLRHGILRKHLLTAQLDRIRTVDAEASLLRRLLRIVNLHIGTGAHKPIALHGIDAAQAAELHRALLDRRRDPRPTQGQGTDPQLSDPGLAETQVSEAQATEPEVTERELARFTPDWLRFAPFTMNGVAVALAAWGLASRIISDFSLGAAVGDWVERGWDATRGVGIALLIIELLIGVIVTLSVLSLGAYALANWGYVLTRRSDATLHVRRGLLTSQAVTIEERRLRGAAVERPLLLRVPRGARARALVTGGARGDQRGARATHVLVPPGPVDVVERAVVDVLGSAEPLRVGLVRHGVRASRRRFTRALFWLAPVAAALVAAAGWWSWPAWTYAAPVLVLALAAPLGALRARWLGHAHVGDARVATGPTTGYVVASTGAFPHRRTALRSRAVIGWVMRETWFQRRAGLVTLEATVASQSGRVAILDVPRDEAVRIVRAATPGLLDPYVDATPPRRGDPAELP